MQFPLALPVPALRSMPGVAPPSAMQRSVAKDIEIKTLLKSTAFMEKLLDGVVVEWLPLGSVTCDG